jgi:hypothetical protein
MTKEEEYFEERAAIMEYDGGLSRSEAEQRAMEEMKRKYRNKHNGDRRD